MSLSSPPYYSFGALVMRWLNLVPKIDFKLNPVTEKFNLNTNGTYIQVCSFNNL